MLYTLWTEAELLGSGLQAGIKLEKKIAEKFCINYPPALFKPEEYDILKANRPFPLSIQIYLSGKHPPWAVVFNFGRLSR